MSQPINSIHYSATSHSTTANSALDFTFGFVEFRHLMDVSLDGAGEKNQMVANFSSEDTLALSWIGPITFGQR